MPPDDRFLREEFDQTQAWGGITTMVMHPEVTGRPMRNNALDQFLTRVRQLDDVWIAVISRCVNRLGLNTFGVFPRALLSLSPIH